MFCAVVKYFIKFEKMTNEMKITGGEGGIRTLDRG